MGVAIIKQSRKHARHIAIDDGLRLVEREAGDGSGGVGADAGQGFDFLGIVGENAAEFVRDDEREFLQIFCAAIVAEPLPCLQHLRLAGGGERLEIGEALHPSRVVAALEHGGDLRLLEHDFGDENRIRIGGAAPRVVASVCPKPAGELFGKCGRMAGWSLSFQAGEMAKDQWRTSF